MLWMMAVPYFRRLVACFLPQRLVFKPRSGHVRFVVDKLALGQVFYEYVYSPGLVQ
jgi:hypothetical protein